MKRQVDQIKKLSIYILILVSVNSLFGASLQTKLDTSLATIGDHLHLTITATHSKQYSVQFPTKKTIGRFEVINRSIKNNSQSSKLSSACTFTISTYDTGKTKIPQLKIHFQHTNDTSQSLVMKSNSLPVNIISVLPPKAQKSSSIKDIKPPFPIRTVIPWDLVIFFTLLIGLTLGAFFSWKKWKENQETQPEVKEEYLKPPHIVAQNKLEALKQSANFASRDEIKEFYTRLSRILRQYLERRFFILALEMSTTEIINVSDEFNISPSQIEKLKAILKNIDLVKYAAKSTQEAEALELLDDIYDWIENTKKGNLFSNRSDLTEVLEKLDYNQHE